MNKRFEKKTEGIITYSDYRKTSVKIFYWGVVVFLVICSLIALLPIIYAFFSGFKELAEYYSVDTSFMPETIDWRKLVDIAKI